MADEPLDLDNLDPEEPENWKRMREYAKRQEQKAQGAEVILRENAFLRAGINLDTRLGKAFAQTYAGKLDDIEAIRADAKDFDPRILAGEQAQPVEESQAQPAEEVPPPSTGSQERINLADGATPTPDVGNVMDASVKRAKELLDSGKQWDVSAGELIAIRARAANEGTLVQRIDQRTGNRSRF